MTFYLRPRLKTETSNGFKGILILVVKSFTYLKYQPTFAKKSQIKPTNSR